MSSGTPGSRSWFDRLTTSGGDEAAHPETTPGLSPAWRAALWALVLAVLAAGLFLPDLMYGDAPQDAVMALRMFREGDWAHLLKNGQPYLDKPHLLFWSAIAGYKLFGVHDWSYRLFSVLASLLGAWSSGRLARRLYGARAGQLAAIFFITAERVLLSNHDVRMEALLAGFTAFGMWQLTRWADTEKLGALALGAAGIGLAVGTKGMVAAALAGLCLVLYLAGRGRLRLLASPKLLVGVAAFFLALAPVLWAYWVQFDSHPELVVRGRAGVSGLRFILLGQSAERFTGGHGQAGSSDYLFFYYTLLWAFLPWSPLLFAAWGSRFRALWKGRLAAPPSKDRLAVFRAQEQLTFLGPFLYFTALNFSAFKLDHYVNVAFPMLAVLAAGYAEAAARAGGRRLRVLTRIQDAVVAILVAGTIFLNGWAFPVESWWVALGVLPFAAALVLAYRLRDPLQRLWVPSAVAILLANFALNANFFPQLCRLQPGSSFVERVRTLPIDWSRTFFVGEIQQSFQFYAGRLIPEADAARIAGEVAGGEPAFVLANEAGRQSLEQAGLSLRELADSPACRITMPRWKMIDPRTRPTACPRVQLLEVHR
jgi:4-amino-4-deoxy-L-arabinose transferase-like glycosyltransferase